MSRSRPSAPDQLSLCSKDHLKVALDSHNVPETVQEYLTRLIPPSDAVRAFANAFTGMGELPTGIERPSSNGERPGEEAIHARSSFRGDSA